MPEYPPELTVKPLPKPPRATVRPPGSKSLTNRALIIASMAEGKSTLSGALESDDTRAMIESLRKLGLKVEHDPTRATITVFGRGGHLPEKKADLFVGNSGTSVRFLTAMLATAKGEYHLDGTPRMRERPAGDLIAALNSMGGNVVSDLGTGCPPLTVKGDGLDGGYAFVKGDISSQFLSAILMAAPKAKGFTSIEVQGTLVSKPYVAMTLEVMESFGIRIGNKGFKQFNIEKSLYQGRPYPVEPDASAASYFFAAAAITGGTIKVDGLGTTSVQGDMAFVDVLEHMGCKVTRTKDSTTVEGPPRLRGLDVDMNAISDTVMTLAVVALFADGMTRIRNVAHIRHKETDRIAAVATELRKLGATVEEGPDSLLIFPPAKISPARIDTYDDHRMAMAFALAGLKAPGVTILDPGCVAKTYPGFWTDLAKLG